jgi:hypothetical protein
VSSKKFDFGQPPGTVQDLFDCRRERDELRAENERLKADPYKAGYIDGHHDAHARRNEAYRDCPRCS